MQQLVVLLSRRDYVKQEVQKLRQILLVTLVFSTAVVLAAFGLAGIFDILKGTIDFGLIHSTNFVSDKVRGFCDVDFGGDIDTQRSRTRDVFQLVEELTAWDSKGQKCTVASTKEAEHIAACIATKEATVYGCADDCFMQTFHRNILLLFLGTTGVQYAYSETLSSTNEPSTSIANITLIREKHQQQEIGINYVSTHNQIADIMTKHFTQGQGPPISTPYAHSLIQIAN